MREKVFGFWFDYGDIADAWFDKQFNPQTSSYELVVPDSFPKEEELLFASYGGSGYEGDAYMLWRRNGVLLECGGYHCSCYGLEGQFEPDTTTVDALLMRRRKDPNQRFFFLSDHDPDAYGAFWNLVDELQREAI